MFNRIIKNLTPKITTNNGTVEVCQICKAKPNRVIELIIMNMDEIDSESPFPFFEFDISLCEECFSKRIFELKNQKKAEIGFDETKAEILANKITKLSENYFNPKDRTDFDFFFGALINQLQEENRFNLFSEIEKNIISTGLHSLTTLSRTKSTPEGKKMLLKLIKEIRAAFDLNDDFYKSETWLHTFQNKKDTEVGL
jgi:hypothetical protein